MSTDRPKKFSTGRNATDHGENALELRHGMPNKWGLDESKELYVVGEETTHDEISTCKKHKRSPLVEVYLSVDFCLGLQSQSDEIDDDLIVHL